MTLAELWQLFPIVLSEHDPAWKNFYADEAKLLQKQFKHDRDAYTEAKGEFIRKCVKAARNIK